MSEQDSSLPSYLVAADVHNIASNSTSWTQDLAGTLAGAGAGAFAGSSVPVVGTAIGGFIGGVLGYQTAHTNGAFAAASVVSGAASFYNTGVLVANWFGADAQEMDVAKTLTDYDTDFGKYYRDDPTAADVTGFIAGSFLPFGAVSRVLSKGTKVLELANEGRIGANMSASTGLLASTIDKQVAQAALEIGTSSSASIFSNAPMIKAFATGVGAQAAEGALGTAAVYATMYASPILNQSDLGDIVGGILTGGLFQGAIGGLIKGAENYGKVSKAVKAFEEETKYFTSAEQLSDVSISAIPKEQRAGLGVSSILPEKAKFADEILTNLNTKLSTQELPAGVSSEEANFLKGQVQTRNEKLSNKITESMAELLTSPKDRAVSNMLSNLTGTFKSVGEAEAKISGLREIGRAGTRLKTETEVARVLEPKAGVPIDELAPEASDALTNSSVKFLGLSGADTGKLLDKPSELLRLADLGELEIRPNSLLVQGAKESKFSFPEKNSFKPMAPEASLKEAEASYIWAQHGWNPSAEKAIEVPIAELHKATAAIFRRMPQVTLVTEGGEKILATSSKAKEAVEAFKLSQIEKATGSKVSVQELARRLDVTPSFLEGTGDLAGAFANYSNSVAHTALLESAGKWQKANGLFPTELHPSYAKLAYDTSGFLNQDGNLVRGMAAVKQRQRIFQDAADRAVAGVLGGKYFSQLPDMLQAAKATKYGESQGVLASSNGAYGSQGSITQQIGKVVHTAANEAHDETVNALNSAASAAAVSKTGAIEFQVAVSKTRATPEPYVLSAEDGGLVLARNLEDSELPLLDSNAPEIIPLGNEAFELAKSHMEVNAKRVAKDNLLSATNGFTGTKKGEFFYPPPPNPDRYKFFAFVSDPTITGSGHTSMLYASSAQELDNLISKTRIELPHLAIRTKDSTEEYFKALGEFKRSETITENSINSLLARKGISSNFAPNVNPDDIVKDLVSWHKQQDTNLVRRAVATKYSKEFNELNFQGSQFTSLATSKAGGASLSTEHNPFHDLIKQSLDISNLNEIPKWTAWNNTADAAYTGMWNKVKSLWSSGSKQDLDSINSTFETMGFKGGTYDSQMLAYANHPAGEGALKEFVAKQNAILATLTLRLEPMNAVTNLIGSPILTSAELHKLDTAIIAGNEGVAGKLGRIKFQGQELKSPLKDYAESAMELFNKDSADMAYLREKGFASPRMIEVQNIIEDLKIHGTETKVDFDAKIARAYDSFMKLGEFGERVTGNKLAEESNRLIAAHMMLKRTKLGVEQGVMSENEALPYINTFVNRTQGNYLASQRPLLFSGPVGGALGLFQTYQFNLAQQMLTHIADGSKKSAAVLLGMQSTLFGMHGLPAFDAINSHIIGTYSGNQNHRDLYDATYGVAGKEAGDFLMYGAASNLFGLANLAGMPDLKLNLYSRGDINPRFATVVPTNPADFPIVKAWAKVIGGAVQSFSKIAQGGDITNTFLSGIEHASLNRPLTGIAQTLQGYDTSTKGDMIVANDLGTLATLVRVAGARPLEEAIALDSAFRISAYASVDADRRKNLMEAVKTTVIGGGSPSAEQVSNFSYEYAKTGGTQDAFIRSMMQVIKKTNTSQANEVSRQLKSPLSQSMQRIMGGAELKDLSNSTQTDEGTSQ